MSKFKAVYDENEDIITILKENSKSSSAVELGNFTFDFDNKKNLVGMEIIHALEFFSDIAPAQKISLSDLNSLAHVEIDIKQRERQTLVYLNFEIRKNKVRHSLIIPSISRPLAAMC